MTDIETPRRRARDPAGRTSAARAPVPDEITRARSASAPCPRVVAFAAALVIASVLFVASRPKHHAVPVSPSTTTPTTGTTATHSPARVPVRVGGRCPRNLYVADEGASDRHRSPTAWAKLRRATSNSHWASPSTRADCCTSPTPRRTRFCVSTPAAASPPSPATEPAGFSGDGGPRRRAGYWRPDCLRSRLARSPSPTGERAVRGVA